MKRVFLNYESSIKNITEINKSVATGILRVAYTNENQNGSYISKEAFERAIPTIYNKPIVGNFIREEDDFGGHDIGVVKDNGGELRIVNFTTPIGVVPESASYFWEEIDGHEYLCVDVIIWKRQEGYRKIKEEGIVSESMEIDVADGYEEEDTGLFVIENFEFTAFCLLGSGVKPCFEDAALEIFSTDNMKALIKQMMSEIKETFYSVNTPEGDDIQSYKKGGETVLDEKKQLAEQFGIDIESIDFSIEEMSVEELTEKFEEMTKEHNEIVSEEEIINDSQEDFEAKEDIPAANEIESSEGFALNRNVVDEIIKSFDAVQRTNQWGELCPRYCFEDFDADTKEVFAWDMSEGWVLYGFKYSMDGDVVAIDFDSKVRKKYVIVDFDEGIADPISMLPAEFSKMEQSIHDNTEWKSKYDKASETISVMETELNELKEFKAITENNEARIEREELFSQFDDLVGIEEFDMLVENCSEFDIETLEEKCYAIRGKNMIPNKFSIKKPNKIIVPSEDNEKAPYGGIVEKYIGSK